MAVNQRIHEILDGREARAREIAQLNERNGGTVISFTVNFPGPDKLTRQAEFIFKAGMRAIEEKLNVRLCKKNVRFSGYEAFFVTAFSAVDAKKALVELEDSHLLGRLFDIDVFEKDLTKLSRDDLALPKRKCLLCDRPAVACGRSRRHSVEELIEEINHKVDVFEKRKTIEVLNDPI
ncbi:citrate lyase holo-[acyl-carrier protein] synthase [Sporolactobacillus pectinivorans]|uniref:citrate lyase holo-[acyl-carrier protein] synthase n=1 Tax=Sporolactobacillus pectinivorans TaxID=1591408 RepID=UPI000C259D66|nr:citrate lyase holo-[acyl-carrier protein] synthase [Sporolactobacillus pectinivorans]